MRSAGALAAAQLRALVVVAGNRTAQDEVESHSSRSRVANLILLVLGMFIDGIAMIVLTAPSISLIVLR
ncbi:hypothetical protein RFUL19S_00033 [Rhizobacter fulvus]